jgi:predicted dehydrogenase
MPNKFRVGVFGLWRGLGLAKIFATHGDVEVVAGCDQIAERRKELTESFPGAEVLGRYDEFLKKDFDILLLASPCTDHGPDAVKGLRAGKHVFSEVTAFLTPAEGVALVEAVEASGRQYMMAENYCYFNTTTELARLYRDGEIGELEYAECECVQDVTHLMSNPDGSIHWRGWLPSFYYNTHSLGPILLMSGLRPVEVTGFLEESKRDSLNPYGYCIAMVRLNNGAYVRVLQCWATPGSSTFYGVHGTRMHAVTTKYKHTELTLVRDNRVLKTYTPDFPAEKPASAIAGREIDFFTIHYFMKALRGQGKVPMDVYASCDMTLPGILAYRSAVSDNKKLEVPDFRDKAVRDRYRSDHFAPPREEVVRKGGRGYNADVYKGYTKWATLPDLK